MSGQNHLKKCPVVHSGRMTPTVHRPSSFVERLLKCGEMEKINISLYQWALCAPGDVFYRPARAIAICPLDRHLDDVTNKIPSHSVSPLVTMSFSPANC